MKDFRNIFIFVLILSIGSIILSDSSSSRHASVNGNQLALGGSIETELTTSNTPLITSAGLTEEQCKDDICKPCGTDKICKYTINDKTGKVENLGCILPESSENNLPKCSADQARVTQTLAGTTCESRLACSDIGNKINKDDQTAKEKAESIEDELKSGNEDYDQKLRDDLKACVDAGECVEVAGADGNDAFKHLNQDGTADVVTNNTNGQVVDTSGGQVVDTSGGQVVDSVNSSNNVGNPSNPSDFSNPSSPTNPYQSLQNPNVSKPQSFSPPSQQKGFVDRLADFIKGPAALRNTPEGQQGQPQVIYVTPEFASPNGVDNGLRSIQEIASDISAQTSPSLARVDHFAQTLTTVGGPNALNTENKSYGRLQDLIVEDEAIRALRVAEEKGKQAKNTVFCGTNETSQSCNIRRETKAKEVERKVFVEELEKRVLPTTAIQHFLAVYDGWIRPSIAPKTFATSTLSVLNSENNEPAAYELTTGGNNFVLWIIDSVADAATDAVSALVDLILGGDDEIPPAPIS